MISCIISHLLINSRHLVRNHTHTGSKFRPESYTCRLLNSKFVDSQPWLEYPIVFAPIHRGRLTIWSGVSSLPASEFKCYSGKNGTGSILLDFSNYADKLEWTYYGKCCVLYDDDDDDDVVVVERLPPANQYL